MSENSNRGSVVVYSADIRKPPLLDSREPEMILIKDRNGEPMILLVHIFTEDTWGLCTRTDEDWDAMLLRYGFAHVKAGVSPKELITGDASQYVEKNL